MPVSAQQQETLDAHTTPTSLMYPKASAQALATCGVSFRFPFRCELAFIIIYIHGREKSSEVSSKLGWCLQTGHFEFVRKKFMEILVKFAFVFRRCISFRLCKETSRAYRFYTSEATICQDVGEIWTVSNGVDCTNLPRRKFIRHV